MNQNLQAEDKDLKTLLVTGGAGFLGRAILQELVKGKVQGLQALQEVRVFDTKPVDEDPFAAQGSSTRLVSILGDVCSLDQLRDAVRGVDAVIHGASLIDWGNASAKLLEEVNIVGTENLIRACQEGGVEILVYTSTMDVVCSGKPITDADETLPYPATFADEYARTKACAEQVAIAANGSKCVSAEGAPEKFLRVCSVRPCGMFGEADPYHMGNVLSALKSGQLSFRLGKGDAVFQHVYVGNVAHAHLLALSKLVARDTEVAGQIYLATDMPAVNFFDALEPIIVELGYEFPPKTRYLPFGVALVLGTLLEGIAFLLRPLISLDLPLTRSSVKILCQDMSIKTDKAQRELGYRPIYSEAEAIARTVAYYKTRD
ncbi:MAG: NAD-dependent epimerase/dehydratase family protein [Deltaproteobacteria bacterium]|nr:NAD-dependent epimerase/dehydratase family protein [Deltaproteobacteria bacterium]